MKTLKIKLLFALSIITMLFNACTEDELFSDLKEPAKYFVKETTLKTILHFI